MTFVLYHADCYDGFGAAWAAWKALGDDAKYIPVKYGEPIPVHIPKGATVYILDFSYPRDVLLELANSGPLKVFDHHHTAKEALAGLPFATFDMDKSGARLAWEYFHPSAPKPAPWLIRYVEDRDLWHWALPDSKEVSAALRSYPMQFGIWDGLLLNELINEGGAILRFTNQQVAMICDKAYLIPMAFWNDGDVSSAQIPIVNATAFWSEVGHELLQRYPAAPFSATYYHDPEGKHVWSLRSRGDFDVSELAKRFGGGGHKAAAGFTTKTQRVVSIPV